MSAIKIAGKSPTDTVQSVAVTAEGNVQTIKKWVNGVIEILNEVTPSAGTTAYAGNFDVSDVGAFSLRIYNTTNVPITIGFYSDWYSHEYQMRDADGNLIRKTLGVGKTCMMITPDDIPQMMWMRRCKLYYKTPDTEETITGTLSIWAVTKG